MLRLACVLAAIFCATGSGAAERRVEIDVPGGPIVGALTLPEGDAPPPVVLMLHSFKQQRNERMVEGEEEGAFSRAARLLAAAGIASLRIDFRGSGESGGEWRDTTFSGQISDAVAALDWLREQPEVDGDREIVLGWTQGGLVAAHVAALRPDVAAAVLWAPMQNPLWNFTGYLGPEATTAALAAAPSTEMTVQVPMDGETILRAGFWQEMTEIDPVAAAARYPGPLMVIVGARDELVTPQPAAGQIFLDYHTGVEELVVLDTGNSFDVRSGPEVLDDMISRTREFIAAVLP